MELGMVLETACLSEELLLGRSALVLVGPVYLGSVLGSGDLCKSGQMQWDFQEKQDEKEKLAMLLETHPSVLRYRILHLHELSMQNLANCKVRPNTVHTALLSLLMPSSRSQFQQLTERIHRTC